MQFSFSYFTQSSYNLFGKIWDLRNDKLLLFKVTLFIQYYNLTYNAMTGEKLVRIPIEINGEIYGSREKTLNRLSKKLLGGEKYNIYYCQDLIAADFVS